MKAANSQSLYYEHSGVAHIDAVVVAALPALGASFVVGMAYGLCTYGISVKGNLVLCFLMAAAIGCAVLLSARFAKLRSRQALTALGLGAAAVGLYAAWAFWLSHFGEGVVLNPLEQARAAAGFLESGVYRGDASGILLVLIWVAEAAVVVTISCSIALGQLEQPFCERCDRWAESTRVEGMALDLEDVRHDLEAGDYHLLSFLPPREEDESVYTEVHVFHCPSCPELNLVSLEIAGTSDAEEPIRLLRVDGRTARRLRRQADPHQSGVGPVAC